MTVKNKSNLQVALYLCFRGVAFSFVSNTKCIPRDKTLRAYDSGRNLGGYRCVYLGTELNRSGIDI